MNLALSENFSGKITIPRRFFIETLIQIHLILDYIAHLYLFIRHYLYVIFTNQNEK